MLSECFWGFHFILSAQEWRSTTLSIQLFFVYFLHGGERSSTWFVFLEGRRTRRELSSLGIQYQFSGTWRKTLLSKPLSPSNNHQLLAVPAAFPEALAPSETAIDWTQPHRILLGIQNIELELKLVNSALASHNSKSSPRSPWKKLWKRQVGFLSQLGSEAPAEVRYLDVELWLLTGSLLLSAERPEYWSLVLLSNNFPCLPRYPGVMSKAVLQRVACLIFSSMVTLCECQTFLNRHYMDMCPFSIPPPHSWILPFSSKICTRKVFGTSLSWF